MAGDASQWVSYDEAATLLGMPTEAVKRLALHRGWPRRPGSAGDMLVAVPEAIPGELSAVPEPDEVDAERDGARSLLAYLEAHVERLTEELAEARALCARPGPGSRRADGGLARQVRRDQGRAGPARGRADRVPALLAYPRATGLPRQPFAQAPAVLTVRHPLR